MNENKLQKIITDVIIKEYYRGFENDLKDFGFASTKEAARVFFLKDPDLFSVDSFDQIVDNSSELSTLSYAFDSWKKQNPNKDIDDLKREVKVEFQDEEGYTVPPKEKKDSTKKTKDSPKVLDLLDKVFDEFEGIYKGTKDEKLKQSMEYMTQVALANRKDITEGVVKKLIKEKVYHMDDVAYDYKMWARQAHKLGKGSTGHVGLKAAWKNPELLDRYVKSMGLTPEEAHDLKATLGLLGE